MRYTVGCHNVISSDNVFSYVLRYDAVEVQDKIRKDSGRYNMTGKIK